MKPKKMKTMSDIDQGMLNIIKIVFIILSFDPYCLTKFTLKHIYNYILLIIHHIKYF